MDSSLCYLTKRDGDDKDPDPKDNDYCGPLHRGGDCNYTNCSFTVDHYHCQMCGSGAVEASEAVSHFDSSPSCRRDPQYQILNDSSSALYNALYGGLSSQNSYGPSSYSSYSGYSQLDSFQWHPSVGVDKMGLCGPQLSPCFGASNNSRIQLDPTLCSPIGDLYSKVAGPVPVPVKDLVNLPAKSSGTPSDSQSWFYNTQPMQVYKFVEQTSVPQINFLLLDPSAEHKESSLQPSDLLPFSYSNKSDCNLSMRDLKEPFAPYNTQHSLQTSDETSLFALQIHDENATPKHAHLFPNQQEVDNKGGKGETSSGGTAPAPSVQSCCLLLDAGTEAQSADLSGFTQFAAAGNISDGNSADHSSSGSDSEESDIVVEDTEDELSAIAESEMSIETIKCSLLQGVENVSERLPKDNESYPSLPVDVTKPSSLANAAQVNESVWCAICGDHSSACVLIHLGAQLPETSTSHSPVLMKLSQIVTVDAADILNDLGGFLCQRCLGLIDAVDSLESQLNSAREKILQMLKVADVVKSGVPMISENALRETSVRDEIRAPDTTVCSLVQRCEKGGTSSIVGNQLPSHHASDSEPSTTKATSEEDRGTLQENPVSAAEQDKCANAEASTLREIPAGDTHTQGDGFQEKPATEQTEVQHIQPERRKYDLFCDLCGSGVTDHSELKSHLTSHKQSDASFLCEICGRSFQYRHEQQVDHHLSHHFSPNRFFCSECDKGFKTCRSLKEHSKVHSGDRPFPCPNCDRRFAHQSNMRSHSKICTGDLPFRCDKCKAGFATSSGLERHIARTHDGITSFKCTQCAVCRTFAKLSDLQIHQRVHSTLRAFTCQVCNRSYKSLSNLNHHAKTHSKEKPFSCEICGRGFLRKSAWEAHMYSHKGEKPFKCAECPKSFGSKENLSMHAKRHAGLHKKNKCHICDKTFSERLSVHLRTHTGVRPYRCQKCHKSFSTGSSLNKHKSLKHPSPEA